jgi:hypothetical protein
VLGACRLSSDRMEGAIYLRRLLLMLQGDDIDRRVESVLATGVTVLPPERLHETTWHRPALYDRLAAAGAASTPYRQSALH